MARPLVTDGVLIMAKVRYRDVKLKPATLAVVEQMVAIVGETVMPKPVVRRLRADRVDILPSGVVKITFVDLDDTSQVYYYHNKPRALWV